ncbi:MAG: radical SAM protein [Elusimicrobiota bacterium]|nr:radical SAM protein [Elusimicrobiota bacterium]
MDLNLQSGSGTENYDSVIVMPQAIDADVAAEREGILEALALGRKLSKKTFVVSTSAKFKRLLETTPGLGGATVLDAHDVAGWSKVFGVDAAPRDDIFRYAPRWESIKHDYPGPFIGSGSSLPLMTSRGCASACLYCNDKDAHRGVADDDVLTAVRSAMSLGVTRFVIEDQQFNESDNVSRFCALLQKNDLRIRWQCLSGIYPSLSRPEVELMKKTGCEHVALGMEHCDPAVLRSEGRLCDPERASRTIGLLKEHGIKVSGYYLLGLGSSSFFNDLRMILNASLSECDFIHFSVLNGKPSNRLLKILGYAVVYLSPRRSMAVLKTLLASPSKIEKIRAKSRRIFS